MRSGRGVTMRWCSIEAKKPARSKLFVLWYEYLGDAVALRTDFTRKGFRSAMRLTHSEMTAQRFERGMRMESKGCISQLPASPSHRVYREPRALLTLKLARISR